MPWVQVPSPHTGRQPHRERTRCPRAVLPEPETHAGFPSHRAAALLSETTKHGKSVFPWCKRRCSSALTSLRENCPQSAVRQQVSPQYHRHGPGQDTTPKNHRNLTASPQASGPQPLRRCSGTGTGGGVPSQVASWLPGMLAPLGVSQAQQSCLGASASRPMMVSQPGAGGVLPAAMAPCPTPCSDRQGRERALRTLSQPDCRGGMGQTQRSPPHGRVEPACVLPLPTETRVCRWWDSRGVTASRLPGGFPQPPP